MLQPRPLWGVYCIWSDTSWTAHSAVATALHICEVACISYGSLFTRHACRKAKVEGCAAISIVCSPELSSMRSNDGTTDRKPQPHSLLFRGEERLEDLFHFFLRNAATPVGNRYKYFAVPVLGSSANEQSALRSFAINHRVTSIDHEIKQHLLKLHPVG